LSGTEQEGEAALDGLGSLRRSHVCGALRAEHVGTDVVVAGWVHRARDHGGVIFADLRDRSGLVQVVFRPDASADAHRRAGELRSEYVVLVRGQVRRRDPDTVNPNLPTGEIELAASELRLLNRALPPPFPIEDDAGVEETVRLRHRLHDLRRPTFQRALRLRHELYRSARSTLSELDFLEIETPILTKATPEGARDFLVPSRLQPGEFYALPQSPQIMKQLLMIGGFDRYFQIARCFRDEDLRADRQLEFTQIDLEMSFVGVDDVLAVLEELTFRAWRDTLGVTLPRPFPRLSYAEAMARYGSDKPDTRVLLELVELTDLFRGTAFRAFGATVEKGGVVKCLPIHDAEALTRGEIDRLEAFVKKELGGKGLAWVRVGADGAWQSPIAKFLSEAERAGIQGRSGARPGSVLFFAADEFAKAHAILGRLRTDLGRQLGRVDAREWAPLLVLDFPMFEANDQGGWTFMHMPFVAPLERDLLLLGSDPARVTGSHYDVVMNGLELGSGSLRNHRSDVQRRIFEILGYAKEEMEARFGFLLDALDAGAPPHGGFAFGLDRMAMLLAGADSLRDVIAFPKTQRGQDLLMGAPSAVERGQLDELGIRIAARPGPR
jgi:aspartyl-tRNA synthetase